MKTYSSIERLLITFAVMTASLMQILDTTIVNVALPHMQGALGTSPDQITWVLTSYLVSSAIFMPLTGYFTDRLGQKKYLLFSIIGFVIASLLCGAAISLSQIVFFRLLQGMFGAALVPLSQAILADVYPPEERGKAMAIWGTGIMLGPILGPTLGGYLTEVASWRWNFYINLPIGILSFFIVLQTLPDTPQKCRHMDWKGLIFISIGIGALQYLLDRGNESDWFESNTIWFAAFLVITGFIGFLLNHRYQKHTSVFDLALFKDKNFSIACLLFALFGLSLYGMMVILPLMLESLMNYPVLTTGLLMAPRGISGMLGMILVSQLMKKMNPRIMIGMGLLISMLGSYPTLYYHFDINFWWIIWPLLLQGIGLGMVLVPLSTIAFSTLPDHMRSEAAGVLSLLRTIGSSIGISMVITLFTRHSQIAWNHLSSFITSSNPAVNTFLKPYHLTYHDSLGTLLLGNELSRQAQMISCLDVYTFITLSFIVMLPTVFFIEVDSRSTNIPPLAHD